LVQNNCKSNKFKLKIIDLKDFERIGAVNLLNKHYNGSPSLLISSVFPEYQLLPWKFSVVPHNFWSNTENQKTFMNWAAKQLNIKEPSDWYNITVKVRVLKNSI
jgi:hypothetical protein